MVSARIWLSVATLFVQAAGLNPIRIGTNCPYFWISSPRSVITGIARFPLFRTGADLSLTCAIHNLLAFEK